MQATPYTREQLEAGAVLLIDKPLHYTSFDVVARVRGAAKIKKVGHAGTLDPLATGLLIVCTGKATKGIDAIQNAEKEYVAEFQLGAVTPSYDAEFPPEPVADPSHITEAMLREAMQRFVGVIEQTPPAFSAIKVDGKRAYDLARKGKEVELKARRIEIYAFELLDYDAATGRASARVHCQKGTYIRSLAHDLGQMLGVGAYLTGLVRTRIGTYTLEQAQPLETLLPMLQAARPAPPATDR